MVYIIINSKLFGPYSNDTLCEMVKDGKILNCDSLCFEPDVNSKCQSVGSYLKSIDSQVSPTHYSSVGQQLSMSSLILFLFFLKANILHQRMYLMITKTIRTLFGILLCITIDGLSLIKLILNILILQKRCKISFQFRG